MIKSAMIRARTEPGLKLEADKVFHKLGLSCSEAINLFFRQVTLRKAIPFDIALPNKATLAAIRDAEEGRVIKVKDAKDLYKKLGI